MKIFLNIVFCFFSMAVLGQYNVRNFGAKADGITLDTRAIQTAIDSASLHGGTVLFPQGVYLTGTVYLKDNISLEILKGATILGSPNLSDYPVNTPAMIFWGKEWTQYALFYAEKKSNITIRGEGKIDGQGAKFKILTKEKGNPDRYRERPYVFLFVECSNLKIDGLSLRNSAFWMQNYLACKNVRISNLNIYNHSNKNNDMIDIDGCEDVIISNCIGDTSDDGITLKSTSDHICKNILIDNCIVSSHCNAIKMGTESHGGFNNVCISNCIVRPSVCNEIIAGARDGLGGVALEIVDGGIMDGINISNIAITGTTTPLFIKLGNRGRQYDKNIAKPGPGEIKNINIHNFIARGGGAFSSSITGLPGHSIKNLNLSNICLHSEGGFSYTGKDSIPENEKAYPEGNMFGTLPAYGLYLRHVENITMQQGQLTYDKPDNRFAIMAENVKNMTLQNFVIQSEENTPALISMNKIQNVFIQGIISKNIPKAFIQIKNSKRKELTLGVNRIISKKQIIELK